MNAMTLTDPAFQAPISGVFQGMDAGDDLSGGITGGYGLLGYRGKVWTIRYHGVDQTLMREDNDGPKGSVEIVILKANANLSKTWYENGWDENSNSPPDCASANGVVPDQGVPKRQSMVCGTCPRNQWNTAPNGGKGKACSDHRRLAIAPSADIPNETFGGPMLLRCPAASLQDLAAFDAKYKAAGYPYFSMVVKVAFDPQESYPKLVFTAVRPLNDAEARTVLAMRQGDAVARVIADQQVQAPAQIAAPAVEFAEAPAGAPVAAAMAQTAPVAGQAQPAQAAAVQQPVQQAPVQQAPVQQAPQQPAQQAPQRVATGFGTAAPVQQPAQQPAQRQAPQQPQAAPQRAMTGFGNVAPVQQAPVQQVQPATQQGNGSVVTPSTDQFDASLDSRLASLIGS